MLKGANSDLMNCKEMFMVVGLRGILFLSKGSFVLRVWNFILENILMDMPCCVFRFV